MWPLWLVKMSSQYIQKNFPVYSEKFPRDTAYTYQIWKEFALWLRSYYGKNKTTAVVWSPAALHQKVGEQHIWQNSYMVIIKNWQSSYYSLSYGDTLPN